MKAKLLLLVLVSLLLIAAAPMQEEAVDHVGNIFAIFTGFASLGALTSALTNLLKSIKVVPDGWADKIVGAFNLLVFIFIGVVNIFGLDIDLGSVDQIFGEVSKLIVLVLEGFALVSGSTLWHKMAGGNVPVLGASHSQNYSIR